MKLKNIAVTGDAFFLKRHNYIFEAMAQDVEHLQLLPYGKFNKNIVISETLPQLLYKVFYRFSPHQADKLFHKNYARFITKSKQTERKIRHLDYIPDVVIHMFGTYSPFWSKFDIPYAIFLDYTMLQAEKNWTGWVPFTNREERDLWIKCERLAYERAQYLLCMSNAVKSSLIDDYGIENKKITVVGSAANFKEIYEGDKTFGSKQILFNASDFNRKGGDLVLAAFKKVKQEIPESRLIIIGKKLNLHEDGVENPGKISSRSDMRNLLLKTDLVVSPAYCDPFPVFLIEAMNYGVPCIVSERDGMPEIVDREENGIVVNQLTADTLAANIISLLHNTSMLSSMSEKARYKVKTQLNCKCVAKNIIQALLN